jgi:heme-degrading monooxygenase HmoA
LSKLLRFANMSSLCNRIKHKTHLCRLRSGGKTAYAADMAKHPKGSVAVIFIARRTSDDEAGYASAAAAMDALAAQQPGYIGMDSVRGADGLGITVSYWASDADAKAWRDHGEHALIRDAGRDRWYNEYSLHVGEIMRSYDWQKS